MNTRIWFITGISSGLGKSIAHAVIEHGDFVVGTFRKQDQVDAFNENYQGKALAYLLDITNKEQIEQVYASLLEKFGRLDILLNNAGYGLAGAIEETSTEETRRLFDANFFGTLALTQTFLPLFRKQRSGHIIQMSSQAGIKATAGFGIYNASKFALEGFSEALSLELAPLGIHVTLVEPGPFRTDFAGSSFHNAENQIADYAATSGVFRERMGMLSGRQEGDPDKAAKAIIDITSWEKPPLRLPLGKLAVASIQAKLDSVSADLARTKDIAESAVF